MAGEFEQPLEDLAEAVLQGTAVDWAAAESSAGEPDREAVRQLKVLAAIAELHRNLNLDEVPAGEIVQWGRLRLLERIGKGAFGEVYRAWDSKLDREVAVKLLRESGARPEGATVLKEARLLARVRHPNVVTVYDADEFDGRVGLWMEFIHGKNLDEILRERKAFDDRDVLRIGIELCRALSAVHEAGLLHRDVKAQNLMQTADGRLVLMDFGTGRELEHLPEAVSDDAGAAWDFAPETFTTAPATVQAGTPLYLAPETFSGSPATVRTDIYSAGVLLFHLLTGGYPVFGATVKEVAEAHANGRRIDLAAKVPRRARALAEMIERAIQPDASKRFESVRDMLAALESVERRAEGGRRRRYWLAAGAVFLAAIAVAVVPGVRRRLQGRDPKGASGGPYFGTTPEKREVQLPLMTLPGTPSPDGRYLPYSELKTMNLALYEFATGVNRTLTQGGDGGDKNFAMESVVSSDSSQIAYSWTDKSCGCTQLRVIGLAGGEPRILTTSKEPAVIDPLEWSLDGSQILAWRPRFGGGTEILLISAADGTIRSVRALSSRPFHVSLSPDSRHVAYDRAEDPGELDRGIFLSTVDGTEEISVVTGSAYDTHPMWTPDGSGLVFASLRTGGPGIWLQSIKDGRPDGKPRLVDKDVGPFDPMTLTRRGSLFYRHRTGLMDVYTVPIDPVTGDIRGEPAVVATRHLGSNLAPGWSPDGKSLVFASWRTLFGPGQNILVFHSLETGVERELEVDLARVNSPRYSSDGRSVFVWGPDRKGVAGQRLIDVESGKILGMYFKKPGEVPPVSAVGWGPGGRYAYQQRNLEKILKIDLQTGREEAIYQISPDDVLQGIATSPDGRWIAFSVYVRAENGFRMFVIPSGGGGLRNLVSTNASVRVVPSGWTGDGKQILFVRTNTDEKEQKHIGELWVIPFEGGSPRSVGLTMPSLREVTVSPGGDRIAFTSGYPDKGIWVFENFLPRTASP